MVAASPAIHFSHHALAQMSLFRATQSKATGAIWCTNAVPQKPTTEENTSLPNPSRPQALVFNKLKYQATLGNMYLMTSKQKG